MDAEIRKRVHSEKRIKHLQKIGFKHQVVKLRKDYDNSNRFQQLKHQQKSKSLKHISKQQLAKKSGNFLEPTKIISVSANKWVIYQYFSSRYVRGYRAHDLHELSVFSKLLVFCTINALITKHKIDITRFQTIVTSNVVKIYRNSKLKVDDIITLDNLIHLLLMDQGQEYELIAAVNIGAYLEKKRKKEYYSVYDADQKMFKQHLGEFYQLVNSYCQTMKMENIKYVEYDPAKKKQLNKCSAADIALLSAQCLKIPFYRQILHLNRKNVEIKYINNQGNLQIRTIQLMNKTVANPFISYFNVCRNWQQNQFMNSNGSVFYQQLGIQPIVVVLLACYGPLDRQKDIQQIIQWYIKQKKGENNKVNKLSDKLVQTQNPSTSVQTKNQIQSKYDPQNKISGIRRDSRIKTQQNLALSVILQQKLKGYTQNNIKDFRVSQKRRSTKRILTQL